MSVGLKSVQDIQHVFDSIAVCEDAIVKEAYQEGFQQGEKEGYEEGFHLGTQQGRKIGAEVGFYKGFARGWIAVISGGGAEACRVISEQLECKQESFNSEVTSEIRSLCQELTVSDSKNPSASKALKKLLELTESFPTENPKNKDILELLNSIRAKFKHCCAILKVEPNFPKEKEVSF